MDTIQQRIHEEVNSHAVVLYMKGDPTFPQCGFSQQVVSVLKKHLTDFHAVNVLLDQDIRQGIKTFANWPTIPQLYIQGTFIGGCDIIQAIDASGELEKLLDSIGTKV